LQDQACGFHILRADEAPGLSRFSRSAFLSEGKMNKAGFRSATANESSKKAGKKPAFS
jgi:hypothetical protein